MGYWNETCGLTNLPIRYGEPVVVIVLQEPLHKPNKLASCLYPDDHWAPNGFPLFGTYDEYGNLDHVKTHPWNQEWLQIADTPDENPHNMQNTHFDTPVMFIHEPVYRLVLEHIGNRPVNGKTYRECIRDKMVKDLNGQRSPLSWNSPFHFGMHIPQAMFDFFLKKYDESDNDAEKQAAIDAAIDCQLFYHALMLLRKGYLTISSVGGQSLDTTLQVLVARYTIIHAQNMFLDYDPPEFLENGREEPIYFFE